MHRYIVMISDNLLLPKVAFSLLWITYLAGYWRYLRRRWNVTTWRTSWHCRIWLHRFLWTIQARCRDAPFLPFVLSITFAMRSNIGRAPWGYGLWAWYRIRGLSLFNSLLQFFKHGVLTAMLISEERSLVNANWHYLITCSL